MLLDAPRSDDFDFLPPLGRERRAGRHLLFL
jgi:hypothetical protein